MINIIIIITLFKGQTIREIRKLGIERDSTTKAFVYITD